MQKLTDEQMKNLEGFAKDYEKDLDGKPPFAILDSKDGRFNVEPNPKCAFYFYENYGFPKEYWLEQYVEKMKEPVFYYDAMIYAWYLYNKSRKVNRC